MGRLSSIDGQTFDVVIVGGGIIGCGAARDAALRGLTVALFEKGDFGSGTTSASTRIVHGGLRYLEMLDFRLVRLDLRERETLLRIAPHLVRPLEFLIPFFDGDSVSSLKLRAGLALYDALSFDKSLPSRRWLTAARARAADLALDRPDVRGAAAYHDARVDSPERLALENALDAEQHHGQVLNYCEAISVTASPDGKASTITVRDTGDGTEAQVTARVVVNATGAWLESVTTALTARRPGAIRTTKGIHIACRPMSDRALVLYSQVDRRLMFAIPRAGLTWIGTTDTDYTGDPAAARAGREDVAYVLASVAHAFPSLRLEGVLHTTAGVRALVRQRGSESSVSRMHRIVDGEPVGPAGVVSVLGGKITGYRAIAQDVTDVVCRRLGAGARRATTAEVPLPGGRSIQGPGGQGMEGATPRLHDHLTNLYGARAAEVLALGRAAPALFAQLSSRYADIGAQVVFGVRHEHCRHLSDFMRRRTLLGATEDQGWDAAAPAAALMAGELGWATARQVAELAAYRRDIQSTQQFR